MIVFDRTPSFDIKQASAYEQKVLKFEHQKPVFAYSSPLPFANIVLKKT